MAKRTTVNTLKAAAGVGVLLVVALVAGIAGVSAVSSILNPDGVTRLQRFANGETEVLVTMRSPGIRLAFPTNPKTSTEGVNLFTGTVSGNRKISTIGDDAVELVYFKLPEGLKGVPNLLPTLGRFIAADLRGKVTEAERHDDSTPPAYQFRVPAPPKQQGDYYVRIMIDRGNVYVLRVRARADGVKALNHFASSYCVLNSTCKTSKSKT